MMTAELQIESLFEKLTELYGKGLIPFFYPFIFHYKLLALQIINI